MGKISFTMDIWTDIDMKPYMAVTAHWLQNTFQQQSKLILRSDLIAFIHIPGSHAGERLAKVFIHILDRIRLGQSKKVCFAYGLIIICSHNLLDWLDYYGQCI
jgi:hypothetical protein